MNAGSFAVSALLLIGLKIPSGHSTPRERFSPLVDLREGAGYILRSKLARGIALMMGLVLLLSPGKGRSRWRSSDRCSRPRAMTRPGR